MRKDKKIFSLAIRVSLRREYFGGLIFVPITGEIIQLNHAAFKLLEQILKCDSLRVVSKDLTFWEKLRAKGIVKEVTPND